MQSRLMRGTEHQYPSCYLLLRLESLPLLLNTFTCQHPGPRSQMLSESVCVSWFGLPVSHISGPCTAGQPVPVSTDFL